MSSEPPEMKVRCGWCNAAPGDPCVNSMNGRLLTQAHATRVHATRVMVYGPCHFCGDEVTNAERHGLAPAW